MLHNHQLLMLLRAQQSASKRRVRYYGDSKPVYYSKEIEELIDRFDLELPETEDFFINVPVKAFREPLEPSKELSPTRTTKVLQQSLKGVIKELQTALATLDSIESTKKERKEREKALKKMLETVEATKKKVKQDEETALILALM